MPRSRALLELDGIVWNVTVGQREFEPPLAVGRKTPGQSTFSRMERPSRWSLDPLRLRNDLAIHKQGMRPQIAVRSGTSRPPVSRHPHVSSFNCISRRFDLSEHTCLSTSACLGRQVVQSDMSTSQNLMDTLHDVLTFRHSLLPPSYGRGPVLLPLRAEPRPLDRDSALASHAPPNHNLPCLSGPRHASTNRPTTHPTAVFAPVSSPPPVRQAHLLKLATAGVRMIAAAPVRVGTIHQLPVPSRPTTRPWNDLTVDSTPLHDSAHL